MDQHTLEQRITELGIGPIRYFETIGSTNYAAARWLRESAPDLSLVVADEQTAGRGRARRRWYTPPGSALAFSVILKDQEDDPCTKLKRVPRYTGLGALAICDVLQFEFELSAQIKWPNDVLVADHKLAGILVDAIWIGNLLEGIVLGIGLNVYQASVPTADKIDYPATSVEGCLLDRHPMKDLITIRLSRSDILRKILERLLVWRRQIMDPVFIQTWEERLAYLGEWVSISDRARGLTRASGRLLGLNEDGSARIQEKHGKVLRIYGGNLSLRHMNGNDQSI